MGALTCRIGLSGSPTLWHSRELGHPAPGSVPGNPPPMQYLVSRAHSRT